MDHLAALGAMRTRPFVAASHLEATVADISEKKGADFLEHARQGRKYAL